MKMKTQQPTVYGKLKSSIYKKNYGITDITQETRKISNKQTNLTLKELKNNGQLPN